jgi:hypothetical protein
MNYIDCFECVLATESVRGEINICCSPVLCYLLLKWRLLLQALADDIFFLVRDFKCLLF